MTRRFGIGLDDELAASLQEALKSARGDGGIPGAQAAVVFADGTVWTGTVGDAYVGTHEVIAATPASRIASITKMFTATTILRLADRGQISVDDQLADWLPGIQLPVPGESDPITIRQVLSHTSGLTRDLGDDPEPRTPIVGVRPWHLPELLQPRLSALGRDRRSHGRHARAGVPRRDPASCRPGVHRPRDQEEVDGQLAVGHDRTGVLEPADETVRWLDPTGAVNIGASGAVVSTAEEVAIFADELFRGNLLAPDTLAAMVDPDQTRGLPGGTNARRKDGTVAHRPARRTESCGVMPGSSTASPARCASTRDMTSRWP